MESRRRSLAKALSWRVIAWSITASVAYVFTGKVGFALSIGFADSLLKIFVYYLHERTWMKVEFGQVPSEQTPSRVSGPTTVGGALVHSGENDLV